MPNPYTHAASAYAQTGKVAVDQRRMEANALLKAAHLLEDIRTRWRQGVDNELDSALLYNRKLWTIFAAEAADDANPLPLEIRNNIANISIFVFKRSMELLAAPAADKIDALADINRNIAAGLLTHSPGGESGTAEVVTAIPSLQSA